MVVAGWVVRGRRRRAGGTGQAGEVALFCCSVAGQQDPQRQVTRLQPARRPQEILFFFYVSAFGFKPLCCCLLVSSVCAVLLRLFWWSDFTCAFRWLKVDITEVTSDGPVAVSLCCVSWNLDLVRIRCNEPAKMEKKAKDKNDPKVTKVVPKMSKAMRTSYRWAQ